jgi:hypothetical protein
MSLELDGQDSGGGDRVMAFVGDDMENGASRYVKCWPF